MIRVSKQTRERLKEFGKMGETYDDVIKKLMKFYESGSNINI